MEHELIAWLRAQPGPQGRVSLGIGDDAALLTPTLGCQTVVTTDMLMDGVDFIWGEHSPALIGRKSLGVNLSDLAAMAASPVAAFVSLAIPRGFSLGDVQALMNGFIELANEFEIEIAGGDTNTYQGPLVINVTALGESPVGKAWTRNGAKAGDHLFVTGPLGGSFLSHQFTFTPRVHEAQQIQSAVTISAAMDISDGLAVDLRRLLTASGQGALLNEWQIPISHDAHEMSRRGSGRSPLQHALGDGEDFELLLAVPPAQKERLVEFSNHSNVPLHEIGEVTSNLAIQLRGPSGEVRALPTLGYVHQLDL